jgi:hypothetical protein
VASFFPDVERERNWPNLEHKERTGFGKCDLFEVIVTFKRKHINCWKTDTEMLNLISVFFPSGKVGVIS